MIKNISFFSAVEPADLRFTSRVYMPNICPMCNTTLEMSPLFGFYDFDPLYRELKIPYVILKCTKCDRISFAAYEETTFEENSGRTADLIAYQLYPQPTKQKEFSEDIKAKYPRFCSVYNEALLAEHNRLNEICGMGYRKALEILIKDYAIEKDPDKEEEIKKAFLANCINSYIKSDKIQALSKASAWIGNDETHYEKRHIEYSIQELKLFIDAVVATIETDIAYEKATALLSGIDANRTQPKTPRPCCDTP